MAIEIGNAYITITPTTKGIADKLRRALFKDAADIGREAGRAMGEKLRSSMASNIRNIANKFIFEPIRNAMIRAGEAIANLSKVGFDALRNAFVATGKSAVEFGRNIINAFRDGRISVTAFKEGFSSIGSKLSTLSTDASSFGRSIVSAFREGTTIANSFANVFNLLGRNISELGLRFSSLGRNIFNAFKGGRSAIDGLKQVSTGTDIVLRNMGNAAKETSLALRSANESMRKFSSTAQDIGNNIGKGSKGVGAFAEAIRTIPRIVRDGLALASVHALKLGDDFERSSRVTQVALGATGREMGILKANMVDWGTIGAGSANDVAKAVEKEARAGMDMSQIMQGTVPILKMAAATQIDVSQAAGIAVNHLQEFGLTAKDLPHSMSVMAMMTKTTGSSIEDLAESFKYAAPTAKLAGMSFDRASTYIGLLSRAGIRGSDAGTALRRVILRLKAPTDKSKEIFKKYGVTLNDASGKMRDMSDILADLKRGGINDAEMKEVFGVTGINAALIWMNAGKKGVEEFEKRLRDSNGVVDRLMAAYNSTIAGSVMRIKQSWQSMLTGLSQTGAWSGIRGVVGLITEGFVSFTRAITSVTRVFPHVTSGLVLLGSSFGVLKVGVGAATMGLNLLTKTLGAVGIHTTKIAKLSKVLTVVANGIFRAFVPLAVIGTIFKIAYGRSEALRNAVKTLFDGIRPLVSAIRDLANNFIAGFVNALSEGKEKLEGTNLAARLFIPIIQRLTQWVQKASDYIQVHKKQLEDWGVKLALLQTNPVVKKIEKFVGILAVAGSALYAIWPIITGVATGFIKFGSAIAGAMRFAIANPWVLIAIAIIALGVAIYECIKHWDTIKAKLQEVGQKIMEFCSNIIPNLISGFQNLKAKLAGSASGIGEKFGNAFTKLKNIVTQHLDQIIKFVTQWVTSRLLFAFNPVVGVLGLVAAHFNKLQPMIEKGLNALPGIITNVANMLVKGIEIITNQLTNIIQKITEVLVQLISKLAPMITQLINQLVPVIIAMIPLIIQAGIALLSGLILAITTVLPQIVSAITQLITQFVTIITSAIPQILPPLIEGFTQLITSLCSMLGMLIPQILEAAITLFMALVQALPPILDALIDAILQLITAICGMLPTLIPLLIGAAIVLFMAIVAALPKILTSLITGAIKLITAVCGMLPTLIPVLLRAALVLFMAIVNVIPPVLVALLKALGMLLLAVGDLLIKGIVAISKPLWKPLLEGAKLAWSDIKKVWNACKPFFIAIWNGIKTIASIVWNFIKIAAIVCWNGLKTAWNACKPFFTTLWNFIKSSAIILWNAIKTVAVACWNGLKIAWNAAKGFFSALWNGIKSVATTVWNSIKTVAVNTWNNIRNAWNSVTGFFSNLWNSIKSSCESVFNAIQRKVNSILGWINNKISSLSGAVRKFFGLSIPIDVIPHIPSGILLPPIIQPNIMSTILPNANDVDINSIKPFNQSSSLSDSLQKTQNHIFKITKDIDKENINKKDNNTKSQINITVNANTDADPYRIANEIAYKLRRLKT